MKDDLILKGDCISKGDLILKADLHTHSTLSDGSESIRQIVIMAKEKGLDAVAITDHDTISHFGQIPTDAGIVVVAGVEISAAHKDTNTRAHVLGYRIKEPEKIAALTQPMLEARNRNSEKQVKILMQNGYCIDMEKLPKAGGKYLYKQHIMDWLVMTGQTPDLFGAFFQKTFKHGGICDFDFEYADVFQAVRTIKEAGGLAVLAHPGQQQNFWLVPKLKEAGLDGLELHHFSHSEEDRETIRGLAGEYGLFLTGGSDFHGRYARYSFGVGDCLAEESGVRAVLG